MSLSPVSFVILHQTNLLVYPSPHPLPHPFSELDVGLPELGRPLL